MLMHHSCIPLPRSFSPCLALSRSYWKCALKLKEIPCIHAEAYLAGELKHGPVAHAVLVQMLAYHVALARGTDVGKPRNLAKSVTVE
ncbi:hypothetical protein VK98_05370 [Chromobacterium sp. LK11]|nr:hypothetical protein VK98_05370 [Chromobacterium sp. LK11]